MFISSLAAFCANDQQTSATICFRPDIIMNNSSMKFRYCVRRHTAWSTMCLQSIHMHEVHCTNKTRSERCVYQQNFVRGTPPADSVHTYTTPHHAHCPSASPPRSGMALTVSMQCVCCDGQTMHGARQAYHIYRSVTVYRHRVGPQRRRRRRSLHASACLPISIDSAERNPAAEAGRR